MGHLKLGTAFVAALVLAACATTDDKYQVGVDDNDRFASNAENQSDVELSDEQQFGFNDGDKYEARVTGTTTVPLQQTAVAGAVIRKNQGIYTGTADLSNYSTVRGAIGSAGLGETLDGGEYTVFAPNNAAFSGMDLSGATQADLQGVLKGHVVKGCISSSDLSMKLDQNGGTYTATTLSGDQLTFMRMGDKIKVADANGYTYDIDAADNEFKNGYVHGITGVLGRTY